MIVFGVLKFASDMHHLHLQNINIGKIKRIDPSGHDPES